MKLLKTKIFKIILGFSILSIIIGLVKYYQLTPGDRNIVKSYIMYKTGILDSKWQVENQTLTYKMISPDMYIDGIYKSMEGPQTNSFVQLSKDSSLLWITGFHVKALDAKTKKIISNDFICHTNVDINDINYNTNFHLEDRIGKQYPRLTSLSHGFENFQFPKGFAFPVKGNDILFVTTEALNHNLPNANFLVKHEVSIEYLKKSNNAIKPLMRKCVYIEMPFDKADPYKCPLDKSKNFCIPVDPKGHSYEDGKGNVMSGHWVIPVGKSTYRSQINDQLQIKDSVVLHAAAAHVHPFATSLTIYDKTTKTIIFESKIINHKNKIGLTKIGGYSSEKGVFLYKNHNYELILEVDNTTKIDQDMMGSMFLFFYDKELDEKLKK